MNIVTSFLQSLGEYTRQVIEVASFCFSKPPSWKSIRNCLFDMGIGSLTVVTITGLSTGMVMAAQAFFQLSSKGLTGTTGIMVAKSMLVELGPTLTAFMITGRVGAALCAELGTMKVTEQLDAMISMDTNPLSYFVAPRFMAMIAIVPILTIYSAAMGILGGYIIAVDLYGMAPPQFLDPIQLHVTWFDAISGLVKACVFGFLIVTIACYQGLKTKGGAQGVGRATTSSVVTSYVTILLANFILTLTFNATYWFFFKF